MAEYVSREEARKILCDVCGCVRCDTERCPFWQELDKLPIADVVSKENYKSMERTVDKLNKSLFFLSTIKRNRAKWIYNDMSRRICSNCGNPVAFKLIDGNWYEGDFCPNCGADMRGGEDGSL